MGEWKERAIKDVVETVIDNRGKTPPFAETGYELLEVNAVLQNNRSPDYSKVRKYVSEHTYNNWFRSGHPDLGDILVPTVGTIGNVAILCEKRGAIAQNLIALRCNNTVSSYYLYYFLSSSLGKSMMVSLDIGGVQPSIKVPHLLDLKVHFPSLPEQKAIASVLSSLDDKIDLLHRQNETLETMAETLFREWFVEEAQNDWEMARIGDFVKTNISSITKDTTLKTIRYLDTGSLAEGKIDRLQKFEMSDAPSRARRIVKHNDVLISTVRPNQKHFGIIKHPDEDIIVSTGFCVITCEKLNPHFIYIFLTAERMTDYLHSIAEGSTSAYPSLKPSDIESLEFKLPPKERLKAFSEYSDNAWNKIEYNHTQIRTLEKLRDTLLPKLMSGEVRVAYDEN